MIGTELGVAAIVVLLLTLARGFQSRINLGFRFVEEVFAFARQFINLADRLWQVKDARRNSLRNRLATFADRVSDRLFYFAYDLENALLRGSGIPPWGANSQYAAASPARRYDDELDEYLDATYGPEDELYGTYYED